MGDVEDLCFTATNACPACGAALRPWPTRGTPGPADLYVRVHRAIPSTWVGSNEPPTPEEERIIAWYICRRHAEPLRIAAVEHDFRC